MAALYHFSDGLHAQSSNGEAELWDVSMQVYDEQTTGMHWQIHKHGAAHHRDQERQVARGWKSLWQSCGPITNFAATLPLPDDLDEMIFASFIREKPIEMVKCVTVDLEVPATAEIVLEGYVTPGEYRTEGPFGDHTGFYTLEEPYPVFHVTAMTHRRNPIYQTTIVGRPPMEDCWMGWSIIRMTLPVLKRQFPEIVDMNLPFEGVFHNLMLVSIRKQYPGHARKIMNAIWGMGQAMFTKCIIVVDADVNVQDRPKLSGKFSTTSTPNGISSSCWARSTFWTIHRGNLDLAQRWESTGRENGRMRDSTVAGPTRIRRAGDKRHR
jgi:4-hydroxy-3-polyprenylbenzoate decarboxylase